MHPRKQGRAGWEVRPFRSTEDVTSLGPLCTPLPHPFPVATRLGLAPTSPLCPTPGNDSGGTGSDKVRETNVESPTRISVPPT